MGPAPQHHRIWALLGSLWLVMELSDVDGVLGGDSIGEMGVLALLNGRFVEDSHAT